MTALCYAFYYYYYNDDAVAVVVDTSHALQRLHGTSAVPTVLVTTTLNDPHTRTSSSSFPSWNVLVPPWMDVCVTLSSSSSHNDHHPHHQRPRPVGRTGGNASLRWKASFRSIRQSQDPPPRCPPDEEREEDSRSLPPSPPFQPPSPSSPMVIDYSFVGERPLYDDPASVDDAQGAGGGGGEVQDGRSRRIMIEWTIAEPSLPGPLPPSRPCTGGT